jgi:GTPase involved in cell partitioning and DNA repair
MEKDKILLSLVDKAKEDEAKFNTQSEAYKAEVEDLHKKLAKANENYALAKASQEISEWWKTKLEKNVEELRESKERCFEKSLDCVNKLKTSFAKVGAYSSEENFIRSDPEGVIEWISVGTLLRRRRSCRKKQLRLKLLVRDVESAIS